MPNLMVPYAHVFEQTDGKGADVGGCSIHNTKKVYHHNREAHLWKLTYKLLYKREVNLDAVLLFVLICNLLHCKLQAYQTHMRRVGQNRIYTPYMTVYLVISLPEIPYTHRIYMVLANPTHASLCMCSINQGWTLRPTRGALFASPRIWAPQ